MASTAADAWAAIRRQRPVAVVLDIGLPDGDGLDLCRRLRAAGDDTPVLFATARDEDVDRILGLELGGDDYLVKPFNPRELVARVRAVLRRGTGASADAVLAAGRVRLDGRAAATWIEPVDGAGGREAEREIALTATEFDLLAHLMRQPGRVFERASLMSAVWGYCVRRRRAHRRRARGGAAGETRCGEPDPDGPRRRVRGRASMTAVAIPTTPAGTARTGIAVRVTLVVIAVAVLVAADLRGGRRSWWCGGHCSTPPRQPCPIAPI